jgi:hypothetical protein
LQNSKDNAKQLTGFLKIAFVTQLNVIFVYPLFTGIFSPGRFFRYPLNYGDANQFDCCVSFTVVRIDEKQQIVYFLAQCAAAIFAIVTCLSAAT